MVPPIVPQWMGSADLPGGPVRVFLNPSLSREEIAELAEEADAIVVQQRVGPIRFVDQDQAPAEFDELLTENQQIPNSL